MPKNFDKIFFFIILSVLFYSCATNIINKSYKAADYLIDNSTENVMNVKPLIVASLVNIDELEESTALGKLIAEQIASRLSQRGYYVKEMKLSSNEFIKRDEAGVGI